MLAQHRGSGFVCFASAQSIRVPCLEAVFLGGGGVADAFCAVGLEHYCFEGAGGGWHCAVGVIGYGKYLVGDFDRGIVAVILSVECRLWTADLECQIRMV